MFCYILFRSRILYWNTKSVQIYNFFLIYANLCAFFVFSPAFPSAFRLFYAPFTFITPDTIRHDYAVALSIVRHGMPVCCLYVCLIRI